MADITSKIIYGIGTDSYQSWFVKPNVKIKQLPHQTLVFEAPSRFYKDTIIARFGSKLNEIAKSLDYTRMHIIHKDEPVPEYQPPLTPEEWSQILSVLSKVKQFANKQTVQAATAETFTFIPKKEGEKEEATKEVYAQPPEKALSSLAHIIAESIKPQKRSDDVDYVPSLADEGVIFSMVRNELHQMVQNGQLRYGNAQYP